MAWWDAPGSQPPAWWNAATLGSPTVAANLFGQFDARGDYDTDGVAGLGYQDYLAFLGTYLGGDAANFGQAGYEEGTGLLTAPRVAPQAVGSGPYQMTQTAPNTRYYGNQRQAGQQAFQMNNPLTAANVPVGQSQMMTQPPAAPSRPQAVRTPSMPTARSSRLGGY